MGGAPIRHEPVIYDALLNDQLCEPYFLELRVDRLFLEINEF